MPQSTRKMLADGRGLWWGSDVMWSSELRRYVLLLCYMSIWHILSSLCTEWDICNSCVIPSLRTIIERQLSTHQVRFLFHRSLCIVSVWCVGPVASIWWRGNLVWHKGLSYILWLFSYHRDFVGRSPNSSNISIVRISKLELFLPLTPSIPISCATKRSSIPDTICAERDRSPTICLAPLTFVVWSYMYSVHM